MEKLQAKFGRIVAERLDPASIDRRSRTKLEDDPHGRLSGVILTQFHPNLLDPDEVWGRGNESLRFSFLPLALLFRSHAWIIGGKSSQRERLLCPAPATSGG